MGGRGAYRAKMMSAAEIEAKKNELDKRKTKEAIKEYKNTMPVHNGISIEGENFETGKMTILRRTLDDIYEHSGENEDIRKWLQEYKMEKLSEMDYRGWAHNRPYPKDDPKYDPKNPTKSKHDNDTHYFLYYTIKINNKEYWANVKMHKDLGEVLYTIESEMPKDLIPGHKK